MDDKHPESLTVNFGGQGRTLKLSGGALRIASIRYGVSFSGDQIGALGLDFVARLVWIALLPDDPDLTEDAAALLYAQASDAEEERITRYVLGRFGHVGRRLRKIADEEGARGKAEAGESTTPADPGPTSTT